MSFLIHTPTTYPRRARSLDEPPSAPSIYDDEFDSDVLDPKWSRFGGPFDDATPIDPYAAVSNAATRTSLNERRRSWWMVQGAGRLVQPITLENECFVWARMTFSARWNTMANNEATAHLSLCGQSGDDRDISNRVYVYINESDINTCSVQGGRVLSGGDVSFALKDLGPQSVGLDTKIQHACYIGIQKIDAIYIPCVSWTNGHWLTITSSTFGGTLNRVSLEFQNVATTDPGALVHGVDFFRYVSGRVLP